MEINFKLLQIKTEQFATFKENLPIEGELNFGTELEFKLNPADKHIGAFALFTLEQNQKVILKLEVSSHFAIESASWEKCEEDSGVTLPKNFLAHIAMITVGTARGVLHTKTEGTPFNRFVIPLVNVANLITEDAVFPITK